MANQSKSVDCWIGSICLLSHPSQAFSLGIGLLLETSELQRERVPWRKRRVNRTLYHSVSPRYEERLTHNRNHDGKVDRLETFDPGHHQMRNVSSNLLLSTPKILIGA